MPLFDSIGKAIGTATQAISDAAKDISEGFQSVKREEQDSSKCPSCGQPLSGMAAVCPLCGYQFRNVSAANTISTFAKEISDLEKKRNAVADKLVSALSGRSTNATDEKIASVIRAFVVPNTKEDIFEFMLLASGNMDTRILAGRQTAETVSEIIVKAWASKFEQTYQKAEITFGNDPDFSKIQALYDKKMQEIEDAKPKGLFSRRK